MTIIPPNSFFIVNGHLAVPAKSAVGAKRVAAIYARPGAALGSWGSMTARRATEEETRAAQAAWIAKVEEAAQLRADREANPAPTPAQLLAILEEAERVIYEQAHPKTAGQVAYERAQRLRNGAMEKAIAALRRDLAA